MAQSDIKVATLQAAWRRAGGRCECVQASHGHDGRCGAELNWGLRGSGMEGGWDALTRPGAPEILANITIVCMECKRKGRGVGF
jgi:hypothetical protein